MDAKQKKQNERFIESVRNTGVPKENTDLFKGHVL